MRIPIDEELPLARAISIRLADDARAIEAGEPCPLLESVTPTTAELLRWWFDASLAAGRPDAFHEGQRDAILAIVYAHEVLGAASLEGLYEQLAPDALTPALREELRHERHRHPKYAAKLATGTGKTWVMNALLVWQHLNHLTAPGDPRFSSNFLVVAPGLIVYERLLDSFRGRLVDGVRDPSTSELHVRRALFIPPRHERAIAALLASGVVEKHEIGHRRPSGGMIAVTNWHLLAGAEDPDFVRDDEPRDGRTGERDAGRAAIESFFPLSPGTASGNSLDVLDRRAARGRPLQSLVELPDLVVFNDEAHHVHTIRRTEDASDVEWQQSLSAIAAPKGRRFVQLDFSATPYDESGTARRRHRRYFPHIVVDFDLHAAMRRGLVKAIALDRRSEVAALPLDFTAERDERGEVLGLSTGQRTMVRAGLRKLALLERQFAAVDPERRPRLLIVTEDTAVSRHVERFLLDSEGLDGDEVLRVDSGRRSELGPKDWERVRSRLFDLDRHAHPRVVVSVLMLREGFDVDSICVVVPLRSAGSGILLEQTIGRGLRLMWRGDPVVDELKRETRDRMRRRLEPSNHFDVLFIIEHPAFEEFYDELLGDGLLALVDDEATRATGDLELVGLREDWRAYDILVPVVLHESEEDAVAPRIDPMSLPPSRFERSVLERAVGRGELWSSHDVETKTQYGDYRVDGGVMTATGYNDFLARLTVRVTTVTGRTFTAAAARFSGASRYPLLVSHRARIAAWIDRYIRARLFAEPFDPQQDDAWRVLLLPGIAEHIAGVFSTALVETQLSPSRSEVEVEQRSIAEVGTISMRARDAVTCTKSVFPKLRVASRGGGLERRLIAWADRDSRIEAFVKIDEHAHDFLQRPYLRADGLPARYSPDFLVRTSGAVYVVETKAQSALDDENVRRKQRAALAWADRLNELPAELRSDRSWHYVLLGEEAVEAWSRADGRLSDLLALERLASTPRDGAPKLY
ncbi:DEAD/DEAH box helicase family protein [Agromyces mediolanus]|uniref:DEAD/DEAH box helicase family protein n=1 Tax=Agromyces mediolanus TaxID=41986 RepID=UPI00204056C6|nr:DEAD/DEAH box helicase family protein [Agromyces mediolanus]MCM3656236.1 DEAD/DEAH box helicase family protein [Agromyces mediolanus]